MTIDNLSDGGRGMAVPKNNTIELNSRVTSKGSAVIHCAGEPPQRQPVLSSDVFGNLINLTS